MSIPFVRGNFGYSDDVLTLSWRRGGQGRA
jgi:hypothetical protein